jgi:beta-lactamase regulating signal transducer with metallopeptidase domain
MIHLFVYLIEANLCLTLMYLCYIIFINNDTFYNLKRYFLLLSLAAAIIIPQLPATHLSRVVEQKILSSSNSTGISLGYHDTFTNIIFGSIPVQPETVTKSPYLNSFIVFLFIIYLIGIFVLIFRFSQNISHILRLIRLNNREPYGKITIIHHNDNYPTFSFLRYIFLNSNNLDSSDLNIVLQHEETHIRLGHSFDIFFIEFCKMVFWFNPVIRIIKKSIIKVHECQVDGYLIEQKNHNILNYQSLLLKQYLSNINIELAHPFNYSLINFRIKMMTKTKSGQHAKIKVLFALPVVIFSLLAFSNANTRLAKQEFTAVIESRKLWEPEPNGMCFIPAGSFVLKRTDGSTTKEFAITIDAFWMNQTEVSVQQYNEYLKSVKADSTSVFYEAAIPDYGKAPFPDYFVKKNYRDFPVVGVSMRQAVDFCNWLTNKENQKLKSKGKPPVQNFRVPSEVEWVYASFGGKKPEEIPAPKITGLTKVTANKPNDWGLYNMNCNVSEWTYTSFDPAKYMISIMNPPDPDMSGIIVRGENYKEALLDDKLILDGSNSYDYVGFRYVRTYLGQKYGKN